MRRSSGEEAETSDWQGEEEVHLAASVIRWGQRWDQQHGVVVRTLRVPTAAEVGPGIFARHVIKRI